MIIDNVDEDRQTDSGKEWEGEKWERTRGRSQEKEEGRSWERRRMKREENIYEKEVQTKGVMSFYINTVLAVF